MQGRGLGGGLGGIGRFLAGGLAGVLEDFGDAFFEHADAVGDAVVGGELAEPAGWFVHVLKGEAEGSVVHGNEGLGADVVEDFDGFVRAHVDVAERFGAVGADGQEGDFGGEVFADLLEAIEVGAVAGVVNFAALMFEDEAAVAAVVVAQHARAPMFTGGQGDFVIAVLEAFPPVEFDDALEAEVAGEVAHAPGHDADFGMRELAQGGFVEMIEVRVSEQDEVNGRKMFKAQAGAFDAFEEEKPVGEIGINEDIEIGELDEKRSVANPGKGDLPVSELGEFGLFVDAGAWSEKGFPDHLSKESARVEGFRGREVLEGTRERLFGAGRARYSGSMFGHKLLP
jgi:hypothetical protein